MKNSKNIAQLEVLLKVGNYSLALTIFTLLVIASLPGFAQSDISNMEYYVDNDPGFGNATVITISTGSLVDITNEIIEASALSVGTHTIGIRARNAAGVWGFTEKRAFFIPPGTTTDPPVADISVMEYYIDDDPGFDNGIDITISTSNLIDLSNEIIAASSLPTGFHTFGVRAKNTDGVWGFSEKRTFYIPSGTTVDPPVSDISSLEYFFDIDPGFGNATPIPGAGSVIDINPLIPESLTAGHHTLHIRGRNTDGIWGITESRRIYVKPTVTASTISDIVKIEYYFDGVDPGVGAAIDLPITSGPLVDLNTVDVATSPSLIDGQHQITFRAQNADGIWGVAETSAFDVLDDCVHPTPSFTASLACVGETVEFVDNSLDIDLATANYRWYVDGALFSNTTGSVFHTFASSGDHTVSLAIRQGTICYDSTGIDINIKPKPIVTFSAEKVELGTATTFDINAFNVDAGAVWEWDFDEDDNIDSNNNSNVSFTYPSIGSFLVDLLVTDELGCEAIYMKSVTVDPVATGGGTPLVIFTADEVEVGSPTTFTVIHESDIDPLWTWSWDFDTDSNPDDNTIGSTSYAYASSGSYTATLTLDDGGANTYEFTTSATVIDVVMIDSPIVVFTADEVSVGSPTTFTVVHESNVDPAWTWSWDFDTDGHPDDNTIGSTSYTYEHTGSYTATLTIDDGGGNTYDFTTSATVNEALLTDPPLVVFSGDEVVVGSPTTFTVIHESNIDPSWAWSWDFDTDGNSDDITLGNTSYTYASAGSYSATLTIDDGGGNTYDFATSVIVRDVIVNDPPLVVFTSDEVVVGNLTTFTILHESNVDPAWTWSWDFDTDGNSDDNTIGSTSYTYTSAGSYSATLTIDDGGGNTYDFTTSATVNEAVLTDPPLVVFTADEVEVGGPTTFTVVHESNVDPAWTWSWDFDTDGSTDDDTKGSTSHTYANAGSYTATLTITDEDISSYDFVLAVIVHDHLTGPPPVIVFSANNVIESQETVYVIEHQSDVDSAWEWSWDFDTDGISDDHTIGNTSYTFPAAGEYITSLTITDHLQNEYLFTEVIRVLPEEVALNVFNLVTFNGDGINDFLHIENIEVAPNNSIMMYDRSGVMVFEMKEYDNKDRVFRGFSNINGSKELPQGNYFYTIDKGNGSKIITGFIYLKR
jgi:gliding motility-associated-like protein